MEKSSVKTGIANTLGMLQSSIVICSVNIQIFIKVIESLNAMKNARYSVSSYDLYLDAFQEIKEAWAFHLIFYQLHYVLSTAILLQEMKI